MSALVSLRRRHFGKCESLGSSPVKMSQASHDPSISFDLLQLFFTSTERLTRLKLLKCAFT